MSFILDGTTLPDPNEFNQSIAVIGDYVTTMGGGVRRNIKAKKNIYTLGWALLTQSDYASLKASYDKNTTLSFSNADLGISTTVHMDRDDRVFVPGVGSDYLSNLAITLREI